MNPPEVKYIEKKNITWSFPCVHLSRAPHLLCPVLFFCFLQIASARSHAVRDVVARRRLADLDSSGQAFSSGGGVDGGGSGGLSAGDWERRPGSSPSR